MSLTYREIEKALKKLEAPAVVDSKNFDEFLAEIVNDAKSVLGSDWKPLESDPYMKHLRVIALRKLHDQTDKNEIIRELLITTAKGSMLDHLGLSRGVVRDEGEYPTAEYEFSLSAVLDYDVVIPAGTLLNSDDDRYKAETFEDAVIPAGAESVTTRVQLLDFVSNSDIQINNIVTELPFVATATQLEQFKDGDDKESDDRYRLRIMAALARSSTAGAEDAYRWYAMSADSRIKDVYITSIPKSLIVDVYVYGDVMDEAMIERVTSTLTPRHVRPLSDLVKVHKATLKPVTIDATVEVFDLLKAGEIKKQIEANFEDAFSLGVDFVKSDLDRKCHVDGVYRVNSDFTDVITAPHEVVKITALNLNFREIGDE